MRQIAGKMLGCTFALFSLFQTTAIAEALLRATKPLPDAAILALIKSAAPTILTREAYPDAGDFTAQEIIDVLCGSFRPAYWSETKSHNNLSELNKDQKLGQLAYSIRWPACVFFLGHDRHPTVTVGPSDTAASIYEQLTGLKGTKKDLERFFDMKANDLLHLRPGQVLMPAYVGVFTTLSIEDAPAFAKLVQGADEFSSNQYFQLGSNRDVKRGTGTEGPHLLQPAGHIASGTNGRYDPPPECLLPGAATGKLDVVRITAAYGSALTALRAINFSQTNVEVVIADNGFFGAKKLESGAVAFGPAFPSRFFYTSAKYKDGQIGPLVLAGDRQTVYPLNYSNKLHDADVISGHGTHITGLVLGGTSFHNNLVIFDRSPNDTWLRLIPLNIGRGSSDLIVGSEAELTLRIGVLQNKIVNLSLSYGDSPQQDIAQVFRSIVSQGDQHNNLFVVAAGNAGKLNVQAASYWPAALGGLVSPNVITVAAIREDGILTSFTNQGERAVDLGAPGCELTSWLNETATETAVSGTSQAAGITTFAAALLRSLGNPSAHWIKRRLFISGDLLPEGPTSNSDYISSRSRLNISTALYAMEDYIRFRPAGDTVDREALGSVLAIDGAGCEANPPSDWHDIWAVKNNGNTAWLFTGKSGPDLQRPCKIAAAAAFNLYFRARTYLNSDGTESGAPSKPDLPPIPLSSIRMYVTKTIPTDAE